MALLGIYLVFGVFVTRKTILACISFVWEDMGWDINDDDVIDTVLHVLLIFCSSVVLVPLWPVVMVGLLLAFKGLKGD